MLSALSGALLLLSCTGQEVDVPVYEVVASWEGDDPMTRSRLVAGEETTNVVWTRNDAFTYKMANGWDLRWMPGHTYICLINPNVSSMGYE